MYVVSNIDSGDARDIRLLPGRADRWKTVSTAAFSLACDLALHGWRPQGSGNAMVSAAAILSSLVTRGAARLLAGNKARKETAPAGTGGEAAERDHSKGRGAADASAR